MEQRPLFAYQIHMKKNQDTDSDYKGNESSGAASLTMFFTQTRLNFLQISLKNIDLEEVQPQSRQSAEHIRSEFRHLRPRMLCRGSAALSSATVKETQA